MILQSLPRLPVALGLVWFLGADVSAARAQPPAHPYQSILLPEWGFTPLGGAPSIVTAWGNPGLNLAWMKGPAGNLLQRVSIQVYSFQDEVTARERVQQWFEITLRNQKALEKSNLGMMEETRQRCRANSTVRKVWQKPVFCAGGDSSGKTTETANPFHVLALSGDLATDGDFVTRQATPCFKIIQKEWAELKKDESGSEFYETHVEQSLGGETGFVRDEVTLYWQQEERITACQVTANWQQTSPPFQHVDGQCNIVMEIPSVPFPAEAWGALSSAICGEKMELPACRIPDDMLRTPPAQAAPQ